MPDINTALFQKIHDQISQHPESHFQGTWEMDDSCNTTRCVAGWAIHFHNPERHIWDTVRDLKNWNYDTTAAQLLGLTQREADYLFYSADEHQAARLVELYALKGREWKE